jgi:type I restriction enzyme S subunit
MKRGKLEDLFDYLPKSKIKAGEGLEKGLYPFYTSSDIQSKYLNDFQHESGCLVFGTGGKASVHLTTSRFATSTDCITIKPKALTEIDAAYVFQYFKSNMQVLEKGFKGAGLKHISKAYLSDIKISYPKDIRDQQRVALLLGKVEILITQRKQHLQQLEKLFRSVFLKMFGDPVSNEKGWEIGRVIDFCDVKGGKRIPKGESLVAENTGFPYIKAGNIKKGEVTLKDLEFVTPDVRKLISRYTVDEGDVCITVVGANIGDVGIVPSALHKASLTENANKFLIKDRQKLNNNYLANYLMSDFVQKQIPSSIRAAGVPKLAIFRLEEMLIVVPPLTEQVKFQEIKKKISALHASYQENLNDLESLNFALSQQAFKGELDLSRVELDNAKTEDVTS